MGRMRDHKLIGLVGWVCVGVLVAAAVVFALVRG